MFAYRNNYGVSDFVPLDFKFENAKCYALL